jgi:hypothetical protein
MDWTNDEVADKFVMGNCGSLSNDELRAAFDEAKLDLTNASETEPNSEWHQACFAAVYVFAAEMSKRGLICHAVH